MNTVTPELKAARAAAKAALDEMKAAYERGEELPITFKELWDAIQQITEASSGLQDQWYGTRSKEVTVSILCGMGLDQRPKVHRVRTGIEAYEADHLYHYFLRLIHERQSRELEGGLVVAYFALQLLSAHNGCGCEFLELGSTLFDGYERIANCEASLKLGLPVDAMGFMFS